MSWRRFAVILRGLPADSEYKTELRNNTDLTSLGDPEPGVHGPWSQTDYILARISDQIAVYMWAQSEPTARPAEPSRYPRPGIDDGSNVVPISTEALAYLEYMRQHQGAEPPPDWEPEVV